MQRQWNASIGQIMSEHREKNLQMSQLKEKYRWFPPPTPLINNLSNVYLCV